MDFTEQIGIETQLMEDGVCELSLEVADPHLSLAARVHGGVLFSLLDSALGRAILSQLPAGRGCATVEIKINYFRPVQSGRLLARAEVVNLGRRVGYAEGQITNGEGKLVARATGTFFLTETLKQSERERV
ncbi:MAG: PaaI family thioesterase [Deltaproteobacteria bacterium]|nr:PaaI family thioesterase [Deltaproteobacteria bacterium]